MPQRARNRAPPCRALKELQQEPGQVLPLKPGRSALDLFLRCQPGGFDLPRSAISWKARSGLPMGRKIPLPALWRGEGENGQRVIAEGGAYAPMPSSKEPAAIGKHRLSRTYWIPLALVASRSR